MRSLSENANMKRTTRAKSLECNITTLYREETTRVDREDKNSKDDLDTNQGRTRTPSAPISKHVKNHPSTLIRGFLKNREKQATLRGSLKEDQANDGIKLGKTILALIDELKTTRA